MDRANQSIEAAIFDLDGTVYRGSESLPGAVQAIDYLRENDIEVLFLSNNPTRKRIAYVSKLSQMGIQTEEDKIITSSWVTARHLSENESGSPTFVVGESALRDELHEAGITLTDDPSEAEILLVSLDRSFDYDVLDKAAKALDSETLFVATNPDKTWPVEDGEIPDTWGMVGAIRGVTGRSVDRVIGKPSTRMVEAAIHQLGVSPESCMLIGDRIQTDIKMASRSGMIPILVLTGATAYEDVSEKKIEEMEILESLSEIPDLI
jgi:arabinose operon protein AraL